MKKKKRKKKIIFLLLLIIFLLCYYYFVYLGVEPLGVEDNFALDVYDVSSNKRPIAVMIDNNVSCDNHVGLQDAFVTYEMVVEGGLSRIMAIYKDKNTSVIGPIRSSRHYFLDYALEWDSLYSHYGFSEYAKNDINALGVDNINGLYLDGFYYRDYNYKAPHNVFTSIEKLYSAASELGYSTVSSNYENLNYSSKVISLKKIDQKLNCNDEENCQVEGIEASSINIPYSNKENRSYSYDSENKYYLRSMNSCLHIDRDTKLQYHYKNIIVMKVNNTTIDSYGRQDLDTVGKGEGYYFSNGYGMPITWEKDSRTSKTKYTYSDGSVVKVNDGNTFIQIMPSKYNIKIN